MNKYLKGGLIVIGIIIFIFSSFVGLILWSNHNQKKQLTRELNSKTKACDSIYHITEQPEIHLSGFQVNEIDTLKFEILRNNKTIKDTLVYNSFTYISDDYKSDYRTLKIPYASFLKSDTIIITTKNKLYFYLTGFYHYSRLNHGMFGPVAVSDCKFSEKFTINNTPNQNTIGKHYGWVDTKESKYNYIIPAMSITFDSLANVSTITKDKAKLIYKDNKQNHQSGGMLIYGIEVTPNGSFYMFGEKMKDTHYDVIKINTNTGIYKRFKNYPFD